jgi:cysteine/O-acetylserine efflux protein
MEAINLGAMLTFVFVTTFTPGPNNITSSSMGILYGYRKTVNYLLGIALGFFGIMLLSGIVSRTLYAIFPSLEIAMRLIGAAYILWLAYKTLKSSYQFSADDSPVLGFTNGLLLQLLNPKVWVYGLTLYTTFLATITNQVLLLIISAVFLAAVAFCATSSWAISGAAIRRLLRNPKFQKAINIGLALLLIYTAIELSGLL